MAPSAPVKDRIASIVSSGEYGMVLVLLALCALFSLLTIEEQSPEGVSGGRQLAALVVDAAGEREGGVLFCARTARGDDSFVAVFEEAMDKAGITGWRTVRGEPADARRALEQAQADGSPLAAVACHPAVAQWGVFEGLGERYPALGEPVVLAPERYRWPVFLTTGNLVNVANQIAVLAIVAIGMTMVIITAGIDLSVGSLVAVTAVAAAWFVEHFGGGVEAGVVVIVGGYLVGVATGAFAGAVNGSLVSAFALPPFIVTLAMMLIARGFAYIWAGGESVKVSAPGFAWLGATKVVGIPVAVVLMVVLYGVAYVVMHRMKIGRYLYAVGGNEEAARLSGVPVRRVKLFAFTVVGALAGLCGAVRASEYMTGSPRFADMFELDVIAAVVVGGTSLFGGKGRVLGTLVGALIIGVIRNGMNLLDIQSYTQKVVLGVVILGAVLLERVKLNRGKKA